MEALRPTRHNVWRREFAGLGAVDRFLLRVTASYGCANVESISGAEHIAGHRDPFILALNHNTRLEALFVPALLMLLRGGKRIHFFADWNFRMIPGVDLLYRRSGVITVPNKRARPSFLNALKPLFTDSVPPMVRARELLHAGASIGIFPEGKVNTDPARLLRGRLGAARLSLEAGVPIVPVGLVLPSASDGVRTSANGPMRILIGSPLTPPSIACPDSGEAVRAWHTEMMAAIGKLSGKSPA